MTKAAQAEAKSAGALIGVRHRYGDGAEARKQDLLARLEARPPKTARAILRMQDDLLFLVAFPGEAATRRAAIRLLAAVPDLVSRLPRGERDLLNDSGIAGSTSRYEFSFPIARWIACRAAGEAEIDWRHYKDHALLDRALFAILRPAELEAAESGDTKTRALVERARASSTRTSLDWILGALIDACGPEKADALFSETDMPIAWRPSARYSTTGARLAHAPVVIRRTMRRPPADVAARICEPMTIERLAPARARRVIETTRAGLSARCREVVAISHANPRDVSWCDLGEGTALAVIGVAPARRLTLETNTGYLLFANGVPIGYGGVTPFFRQANTGINIFPSFRGSEAAALFVEMLRAFRSLYGVSRFIVNGYQFGEGNAEAIRSGAYWFYHRLGFRPTDQTLQRRAAREAARLSKKGAAPSDAGTLRGLARGDLVLTLPDADPADAIDESAILKAGLGTMRALAREPAASRALAEQAISERIAAALGAGALRELPPAERRAMRRLAPIIEAVGGVSSWSDEEKRNLLAMVRAKGAAQERDFARAAALCPRFFRALGSLHDDAPPRAPIAQ